jgi:hypothetical protein
VCVVQLRPDDRSASCLLSFPCFRSVVLGCERMHQFADTWLLAFFLAFLSFMGHSASGRSARSHLAREGHHIGLIVLLISKTSEIPEIDVQMKGGGRRRSKSGFAERSLFLSRFG